MSRIYNFSAGPATLPEEVLSQIKEELFDWEGMGMSVMEISHRSAQFEQMTKNVEADLRELLSIPTNYKILFLQGGGRSQFSMVPLNLLGDKTTADYLETGVWSKLALSEAERYCKVNVVASNAAQGYTSIPSQSEWKLNPEAAYLHYADNETINGLEFPQTPSVSSVPLVCDMSSNMLSRRFNISDFALIYASAQKNLGIAGITLVIVKEEMLGKALPITPTMFNYKIHADAHSFYNTPPTFAWYVTGLIFQWLKRQGGLAAIEKINHQKAHKLYTFIDSTDFYNNPVDPRYRSRMNVIFNLADESLNESFLKEAKKAGFSGLKGHKALGGMRASIYNAMPASGVDALIDFMKDFERIN
jgi:phosphoserine aminotransferase